MFAHEHNTLFSAVIKCMMGWVSQPLVNHIQYEL